MVANRTFLLCFVAAVGCCAYLEGDNLTGRGHSVLPFAPSNEAFNVFYLVYLTLHEIYFYSVNLFSQPAEDALTCCPPFCSSALELV